MAAGWVDHAMWWHVYPLGFTGAERSAVPGAPVVHRLRHLAAWLDYAVDLGLNGLALGPVFASATHGYDTIDHLRIDPRLGDRGDLDHLVDAAHARGMRVMLDGVFNHVGEQHPAFRAALAGGPSAPESEMFRIAWPAGTGSGGAGSGGTGPDGAGPVWDCFEGHRSLVALNHDSARVVDLVTDVMTHWLDAGIDAWRLDAAYAVPPSFWAQVVPRVRRWHPDAYLVGEVIHGDYAAFVTASGLDAVTQYELWKAIWSSVLDRNLHELVWTLGRHDALLDTFVPYTFVGNHDVTRIASKVGDPALAGHALVVLATVAGTPAVYYGDEQAYRGVKEDRAGGDDEVRPPFPPTPEALAGPEAAPEGWATYRRHQALLGLRRRHPWLHTARTRVVEVTGSHLLYETAADGRSLLVALNLADEPWAVPLPGTARIAVGSVPTPADPRPVGGGAVLDLPALGWAVLEP